MQRRQSMWDIQERIAGLVELIIRCHPQGFRLLLGEVEKPNPQDIHEMLNTVRDKLPEDYKATMKNLVTEAERIVFDQEFFDGLIELAGGWKHIHRVSREFKESDPRMWSVVTDHVKFVGNASSRHASKLGYVSVRYGLSPNTVMKYRREFPEKLARMLLMPTGEGDDFYLMPG